MAEFRDIMKQAKRMCKMYESRCERCPLWQSDGCPFNFFMRYNTTFDFSSVERIVMDWAAAHPEPRYPSWNEAWKQLFPDAEESFAPCLKRMLPVDQTLKYCGNYPNPKCEECRKQPISADIAEKLGIKPIGGDER